MTSEAIHTGEWVAQDFKAASIAEALRGPLEQGWSGRLVAYPQRLKLHIQGGTLSAIEGHTPLGQLLLKQGVISREDLALALAAPAPLGQALLKMGKLTETQLRDVLRLQAELGLSALREQPPTFYQCRPPQAFLAVHAGLQLADLDKWDPGLLGGLTLNRILRLAHITEPVGIEPDQWELLRWFNGRRNLGRVIELSGLEHRVAQAAAEDLLNRQLLENSAIEGLNMIVAQLRPSDSLRQPPSTIRANLFLKHLNGQMDMKTLIGRLYYPTEEAALMLTSLYRDGAIVILRGQYEMQRLLEEF